MNEKIGLLYRVSSKPQETDGGSLDVQREMGKKVSKNLGIPYLEFDEGVQSSYNVEVNLRPKLVELLDEIQKKDGIKKVWVFNTDRLGRTSQSWYSILKVFLNYGVQLYIGEDSKKPYDLSNSVDKLVIGVLSLISQYDNELRRMRSIMGKRNSLKSGNTYLGSTIPFGYSVNDKKLVINENESGYIKEIFKRYDEGKSTMDIKMFLDKQLDIKPRRTKLGWNLETIRKMMKNTIYKGEQTWNWSEKLPNGDEKVVESIKVEIPSIVDEDLWKRVNDKMNLHLRQVPKKKNPENISLLKGTLKCSECGLFLNDRYRVNNHYYGRCTEYGWNYNGKKYNPSHCGIGRSLIIEETDEKVLDTVIDIIRNSSKIREEFKIKNLSPRWDDEKDTKKRIDKIKRYLRDKIRERDRDENEIVQIEFDIRTKEITKSMGEKLELKFRESIDHLNVEIENYQKDLKLLSNTKGWINWIDKMSKELDTIKTSSKETQRDFIKENVQEIDVEFDKNTKSHKLNMKFRYPIVGDMFDYLSTGEKDVNGFKKYEITDGGYDKFIELPLVNNRKKKDGENRDKLNMEIVKLIETEGLSLRLTCNELNRKKLYTPTNKKWNKSNLSSHYKNLKGKVPKK